VYWREIFASAENQVEVGENDTEFPEKALIRRK
jgi:hypothetical protein